MGDLPDRTLVLAIQEEDVWLAMKKRGFGSGLYNGYGGKVEEGETIKQAAIREFEEESGASADIDDLIPMGFIDFYFVEKPEFDQRVNFYLLKSWSGEIVETEEMRPEKFPIDDLPFEKMWQGDELFIPLLLDQEHVEGSLHFSGDDSQQEILRAEFAKPEGHTKR